MSDRLLYLSRADVAALAIRPGEAREALAEAFRQHAAGATASLPKSALALGPGHGFQAMIAASPAHGAAALKWVSVAPVAPGAATAGVHALICVNDYATGVPLAVMDGEEITLIRTAALSALAASHLAPPSPRAIGLVGCGLQARAHLAAFLDLYPGLAHVVAFSRSAASAEGLAGAARALGLSAETTDDADALLATCDLVVSTVPGAPGLEPFLDARRMKPVSFASAVDTGRSWLAASLAAFDLLATDSLDQSKAPYDVRGESVTTVAFSHDLASLAARAPGHPRNKRALFCFKGFALADMILADLVLRRARATGTGLSLPW